MNARTYGSGQPLFRDARTRIRKVAFHMRKAGCHSLPVKSNRYMMDVWHWTYGIRFNIWVDCICVDGGPNLAFLWRSVSQPGMYCSVPWLGLRLLGKSPFSKALCGCRVALVAPCSYSHYLTTGLLQMWLGKHLPPPSPTPSPIVQRTLGNQTSVQHLTPLLAISSQTFRNYTQLPVKNIGIYTYPTLF